MSIIVNLEKCSRFTWIPWGGMLRTSNWEVSISNTDDDNVILLNIALRVHITNIGQRTKKVFYKQVSFRWCWLVRAYNVLQNQISYVRVSILCSKRNQVIVVANSNMIKIYFLVDLDHLHRDVSIYSIKGSHQHRSMHETDGRVSLGSE